MDAASGFVCCACTDLIFATRISGTAQVVGTEVTMVRNATDLAVAVERGPRLVIIDMNISGADPIALIGVVTARSPRPPIVVFLSHVQRDLADAAVAAGADQVLPRSQFSADLPTILAPAAS